VPLVRYPNFTGGSFSVQNPLASYERTINFCPDVLRTPGAGNRLVLDPTPGVTVRAAALHTPIRGMYEHNHRVYFVGGDRFYELLDNWNALERGTVVMDEFPVTIWANGEPGHQIFITSGNVGYIYDTISNAFTTVLPSGATQGGMLDGFFLAIDHEKSSIRISGSELDPLDGLTWRATQTLFRSAAPDPWHAFRVYEKTIALFGDKTTEFWYNSGASPFPFEPISNAIIPFGIDAPYSHQVVSGSLFWLARTNEGQKAVIMCQGTSPRIISTPALQWAMRNYERTDDALSFVESYLGHVNYGLTFPTAQATWVYDMTTELWHEEGTWISEAGRYHAMRPIFNCYGHGRELAGDRESGKIYERSPLLTTGVDSRVIRRVRRAPMLFGAGRTLSFASFELVLESGLAPQPATPPSCAPPQVELWRSNDNGKTWWSAGYRSSGPSGHYDLRPTWNRLGATDQYAGFEVVMTSPVPWRIVDALIDISPGLPV